VIKSKHGALDSMIPIQETFK